MVNMVNIIPIPIININILALLQHVRDVSKATIAWLETLCVILIIFLFFFFCFWSCHLTILGNCISFSFAHRFIFVFVNTLETSLTTFHQTDFNMRAPLQGSVRTACPLTWMQWWLAAVWEVWLQQRFCPKPGRGLWCWSNMIRLEAAHTPFRIRDLSLMWVRRRNIPLVVSSN